MGLTSRRRGAVGLVSLALSVGVIFFVIGSGGTIGAATALPSPPFLPTSAINQPIPANAPISPDSAAMIQNNPNWVLPASSPYREWLGPRQRTIYARVTLSSAPTVQMYVNYSDTGGYRCATTPVTVPVPSNVQSILENQAGYVDNDRATWIVDENGDAWEGYHVTGPGVASRDITCPSNRWNAVRYDYWPGIEATGLGYGSKIGASASHIQLGAGLIRPEDMQLPTGSTLGHALRINACLGADGTYAGHPKYVGPATSGDGTISGAAGIPYGARVQLDPSIDVETWPSVNAKADPWREGLKKILRTLQVYGAIVVDHSCPVGSGGLESVNAAAAAPYVMPWEQAGYGWSYGDGIPYDLMSHFRVIDWTKWTGMNATSAGVVSSPQTTATTTTTTATTTTTNATTTTATATTPTVTTTTATTPTTTTTTTATPGTTTTPATTTTSPSTTTTSSGSVQTHTTVVPSVVSLPTISGTAQQGQTLTASSGSWSGSPTGLVYQWARCDASGANCSSIGAAGQSYTPGRADVGATLTVVVIATNAAGSATAVSAPTAVISKPGNSRH